MSEAKTIYPPGFSVRLEGENAGLWHTERNKDGEPVETRIGPPLEVLGVTRDADSNDWGLWLAWHDPDGVRHTWAMPKSMLEGDPAEYRKRFTSEGWSCAPNPRARGLFAEFLASVRPQARVRCVSRTGWHGAIYVFPDEIIAGGEALAESIVLQAPSPDNPFARQGSLEEWQRGVATPALGNNRLMLALCAALAAPLLRPCGQESGGFHFFGASSAGKTTALLAAASVLGKGSLEDGYMRSWRTTDNGLEGIAALHSDAVLILDEIQQASPQTVGEAAFMLGNSRGKTRARRDGTAKKPQSWRLSLLSSGEKELAAYIRAGVGTVSAGQQVRVVDIPADAGAGMGLFEDLHGHGDPSAFAEALKDAASRFYGTAARAFIRKVQEHELEIRATWPEHCEVTMGYFVDPKADGQTRRAAKRFLLCAYAGECAAAWGVLPWPQGAAYQAVCACFQAWLEHRGGIGAAEDKAIVSQVLSFLEQHGQSRFQDIDNPEEKCISRVGYRKMDPEALSMRYYVWSESFKNEITKGYELKLVVRVLKAAGILIPEKNGKPQQLIKPPDFGPGRVRGYVSTIPHTQEEA